MKKTSEEHKHKRKLNWYLKNKDTILFKSKKDWKDKILNESKEEKQKRLKKQKIVMKNFRLKNPEKSKECHHKYRLDPINKLKEKEYYQKNKEKLKKSAWIHKLKTRYGITLEEYEQMKVKQQNLCAICGQEKKLNIDHCHKTNEVRALLCMTCNAGLGSFKDDTNLLKDAIQYLDGHSTRITKKIRQTRS